MNQRGKINHLEYKSIDLFVVVLLEMLFIIIQKEK